MAKKILIIEDDGDNLELFSTILKSNGYETLQAKNSMEGIRLARTEKPNLIITDIQMPLMDGFEAFKIMKSDPSTKDIPSIVIIPYGVKGAREKFLKLGFIDYIAKPFDMHQLICIVGKHIS
jgi:two-component system cell cycle response regulator DivK